MPAPDSSGEQASLTEFSDTESPNDPADLEQRVDRLEEVLQANAENVDRLLDTVERVTKQLDDPADPENRPTHTDIRGYQ